jgi:coenzyme F420-dependent glucose-6-phosphate dehydrogenase
MEIGFHASHEEIDPRSLLAVVRDAEAAGFDAAMCSDHLSPWLTDQGESGYAWSWLGAALNATDLPFGIVTAPGQRQHPVIVAQAIATLAQMFPGRFWAALGSGEAMNEHVTGDEWPSHEARTERLGEAAQVIRRLLAGEEVTYRGAVVADRARVWSLPETPPPLLAAAVSPATSGWAATWADGLITVVQPVPVLRQVVDAYRSAGGRGPVCLQVHLSIDPQLDRAREVAYRSWRSSLVPAPTAWDVETVDEFERRTAEFSPRDMDDAVVVGSDPGEVVDRLRELAAVGFDKLYLHHVGRGQERFLQLAADRLLPALRAPA